MAADYIVINRSRQLGNSLVRAADMLRELRELIDKLKDAGNHCVDASDYTVLEAQYGLAAGAGANALTLINILSDILNTDAAVAGDTRLGQIDEFCSRLAGQ